LDKEKNNDNNINKEKSSISFLNLINNNFEEEDSKYEILNEESSTTNIKHHFKV